MRQALALAAFFWTSTGWAAEPASEPFALSGYRVLYNLRGGHQFRLVPVEPRGHLWGVGLAPPSNLPVTGSGTLNFIPLWDSASDIINSSITQAASPGADITVGGPPSQTPTPANLQITGPSPWVDWKAYGALGNTVQTTGGGILPSTAILNIPSTSTVLFNTSTDAGKSISINFAAVTPPGLAGSTAQNNAAGMLIAPTVVYYRMTYVNNNGPGGANIEGAPSLEGFQVVAGNQNQVTINSPAADTPEHVSGWICYASATSGGEQLQMGSVTNPIPISTNCTINSIAAGTPPPSPRVQVAKIETVNSTTQVKLETSSGGMFSAPNKLIAAENAQVAWGTDDTRAIQAALNACITRPLGCKQFAPPGSYWIQSPGLTVPAAILGGLPFYLFIQGAGAANAPVLGGAVNMPAGTAELVTADAIYPLTVGTAGGNPLTEGPVIENLGFRDISGAGNAPGAVDFEIVSHAFLENDSFLDFSNGTAILFDQGAQYDTVLNPTAINVKTFLSLNSNNNVKGGVDNNVIIGGNVTHSQVGGGTCMDFAQNGGNPSGTNNFILFPSCNFFPTMLHLGDQSGAKVFGAAFQNTASATTQKAVIGSPNSGTGIVLDTSFTTKIICSVNQIAAPLLTSLFVGISVAANCANTTIENPVYQTLTALDTHLADSGTNTQTIGAPADVQNLTFTGPGSSMAQYFAQGTRVNGGNIECFEAGTTTVTDCTTLNATNFVGVALVTPVPSAPVPVQIAGTATVNLDASGTNTPGDFVCTSGMTGHAGQGHEMGASRCTNAGQQIGIVAQTGTGSTALVFLQKN